MLGQSGTANASNSAEVLREKKSELLWSPSTHVVADANITRFARMVGLEHESYDVLHRWSISEPGAFWSAIWDFCGVIGTKGKVSYEPPPDGGMLGGRWFPEARLNFAENLLAGADEEVVAHLSDENGWRASVTRRELRLHTARYARGLRNHGIKAGDAVAGVLPNTLEALVALLATTSLGAVWSSCSPDFGVVAIIDRLAQIKPRVLFAARSYHYAGRDHDISDRLLELADAMPGLEKIVLTDGSTGLGAAARIPVVPSEEFVGTGAPGLTFERVPFDQPLYVLYTSGTTGAPKAIVHRAGGVLLQHIKEHVIHADVRPGDVMSWYTNTAWMMYHWLVSGLASRAAIVLMDGAAIPKKGGQLDLGLLFDVAEAAGITHFGTSPKYLSTLEDGGYPPGRRHDLSKLRWLMSAGAPVSPAQFDWVYDAIKPDLIFSSTSGGTEILGSFLLGSPTLPVRRGHLTCKALGHAVDVMDERNAPIVGRKGDLVCTEPFPSMPLTFAGEGGDERYRATYFADRPGIWTHGDLAELSIHGSGVIYGRTDTTLKPGGVRIGTAEIYAIAESFPEVADLLVFGAPIPGDEEVVLCLVPAEGVSIGPDAARRIRAAIRERASPRHVPHRIHVVTAVPYTINGKRVEGAARTMLAGGVVKNIGSLSNPECLSEFASLKREEAL